MYVLKIRAIYYVVICKFNIILSSFLMFMFMFLCLHLCGGWYSLLIVLSQEIGVFDYDVFN